MLDDNFLVKKTTPLIRAKWMKELDVNEMKIVEVYLSRIDIKNKRTVVRFTKKEFAELLGYADSRNLKTKVFDDRLSRFLSHQIRIDFEDGRGYHWYNLFSDAKCYVDPEENRAMVEIDCNNKLAPIFYDLASGKNGGYKYIQYSVGKTIHMKSAYSIALYNYLLHYAWGNYQWNVKIEDLREALGATNPSYDSYKYLNSRILKVAKKEIEELTDIRFTYERVAKGRKTTSVTFKIVKLKDRKNKDVIDVDGKEIFARDGDDQDFFCGSSEEMEMIAEFREYINQINSEWEIEDQQIVDLGERIYRHLSFIVEDFNELPEHKKSILWMNFAEDVLQKANEEKAYSLYRFLISQWERYLTEIVIRE